MILKEEDKVYKPDDAWAFELFYVSTKQLPPP
jgi:hypothetical protein